MTAASLTKLEQDCLAAAEDFSANTLAPNVMAWEAAHSAPREMFQAAGDAGLLGLLVSPDQGGMGVSYVALLTILGSTGQGRHGRYFCADRPQ